MLVFEELPSVEQTGLRVFGAMDRGRSFIMTFDEKLDEDPVVASYQDAPGEDVHIIGRFDTIEEAAMACVNIRKKAH